MPAMPAYEAVCVVRPAQSRSRLLAVAVGLAALAVLLVSTFRYQAGPPSSAGAVAEASAALRMGTAVAGKPPAPSSIGAPTPHTFVRASMEVLGAQALGENNIFDHPSTQSADGLPSSAAGGTVSGEFSGHTHGKKGEPLSFGPSTYWNVFDPNGSPGLGPCGPGQFGTAGTPETKRNCEECGVGQWCPGAQGDADPKVNDCPDQSTSKPGANKASQCTCIPGWYGIAHYSKTHSCKMCLQDTFCPGGREQYACPANSGSPDEADYCTCDPGYWGASADDCMLCSADYYCPGGDRLGAHLSSTEEYRCPANSNSPAGSDDGTDCQCNAGWYEPVASADPSAGPTCVMCPVDFYCPGGATKASCPANSWAPVGQDAAADCTCNAAYFGDSVKGCATCHANFYCAGGPTKTKCPAHASSSTGSSKVDDCSCVAGYSGAAESCALCASNRFCPGGGSVINCQPFSFSGRGYSACNCNTGFRKASSGACYPNTARLSQVYTNTGAWSSIGYRSTPIWIAKM